MKLARPILLPLSLAAAFVAAAACSAQVDAPPASGPSGHGGASQSSGSGSGNTGTAAAPSGDAGTSPSPTNPSAPSMPTPVGSAPDPADAAVACNLIYESFTFDTAPEGGTAAHGPCDQCLTTNCCEATVTCFANNPDCLALDECYQTCDKQYPLGSGGGGGGTGTGGGGGTGTGGGGGTGTGGGGGGGGGSGDAGIADGGSDGSTAVGPRRACLNACDAAHPSSTATYNTFSACYLTTCKTSCKL
jgi:hypothetical protein